MTPGIRQEHPQGMVLLFVLCILALMMILGSTIFMTTKDDVQISGENLSSREAFTKADLTARMSVYLARTTLYGSPGGTSDTLADGGVAGRPQFAVELISNFNKNGFLEIDDRMTSAQIKDRYVIAADGISTVQPHVRVYYQEGSERQLIGSAAVALGTSSADAMGSLGEGQYDQIATGGYSVTAILMVSADGRVPVQPGGVWQEDPANYFTGTENAKHSIVTAIYQEIMQ